MGSLVLELQKDGMDSSMKVSDLLRKAYVVAKKLKIEKFAKWIDFELNGYTDSSVLPDYRHVNGQVKAHNPYNGLIPVILQDSEMAEGLSKNVVIQPVTELENLVVSASSKKTSSLTMKFPQSVEQALMSGFEMNFIPYFVMDVSQVVGVLESTRNTVLNWALQLEEDGILGEGMTFSESEKKTAANSTYYITNNIGSMSNSQLQQHTVDSNQTISNTGVDLEEVKKLLEHIDHKWDELMMGEEIKTEFKADIQTIKSQLSSTKPKINIIKEGLASVRNILEGMTGSIIATGLLIEINTLLPHLK